ncbi:MAG: ornithine carbamoyltransferase [Nitrospinaceae bacterium]|jgi:ornithine carbamoyltransferase|nr:ornithine carbamoyltransferase [Nitrospinaceae bacterium]MBT3435974.1 ornithine carbamoyltransferase [Nitrospinaceae bacterium]MBT4094824.1 ornithine carbamoyltransferase [Nitrospinaceae bacterium]MBT4431793.1 ornithine carbamoyltransferase [Nitrospinaceae bacterium]MBT5369028.1 ornithine carbamoyltransferase [Nitrospinaceae bacterium]
MTKRDYLSGLELTANETLGLIERAVVQKKETKAGKTHTSLAGKNFALLFEKTSTRTRVSFQVGVSQLGGSSLFLSPKDTQLSRGETLADSAKVLSEYVDGIIVRTFGHDRIEELAKHASVPVINGLTDLHHPCQALADYLTMRERFGKTQGLKIAYLGDGNNVLHSLMLVGALIGVNVSAACAPGFEPDDGVIEKTRELAAASGASIDISSDVQSATEGAHAIYTDVWVSMGQESESDRRMKALAPYQVNEAAFRNAEPDAIFMHCLPAHRGEEVEDELIDGPRSAVFEQAGNRLYAQKILLEILAGGKNAL